MAEKHKKAFGMRLKNAREAAEMSQEELAARCGVNRIATVSDWERGLFLPRAATLIRIARVLNLDADKLLHG